MRLEQLAYFLTIHQCGSIHSASQKLHLTHQSLNRSMKSLEDELGTTLFTRTAKGVSLTADGEKTLAIAQIVLDAIERLKDDIQAKPALKKDSLNGSLEIVTTPVASAILFPQFSSAYNHRHPYVALSLKELPPTQAVSAVLENHSAIGLVHLTPIDLQNLHDQLDVRILLEDTAIVLTNKNHPLAKSKSVSIRSLFDYPFVIYGEQTNPPSHWIFDLMAPYGQVKRCMFTNSTALFLENITTNGYISFFSQKHWQAIKSDFEDELVAIPLRSKQERQLFISYLALLTRKEEILSKQAMAFINMLCSVKE